MSEQARSGQGSPIPIIIVSALLILPISICTAYKLFAMYGIHGNQKTSKFMCYNQIMFYAACIIFAISYPLCDILLYLSIEWRIVFAIETLMHGLLHFYALINIFYARLLTIFSDTDLALNTSTKWLFNTLYAIFIILGIASWMVVLAERENPSSILLILIAVPYLLIMIFLTQFLSCLFVAKLRRFNRDLQSEPHFKRDALEMSQTIRKFTILSVVAMSGTLLYIMFIGAVPFVEIGVFPQWFINMMKQIDLLTNLICLSLSYKFSKPIYARCCALCDHGCQPAIASPAIRAARSTITVADSCSPSAIQKEVSV